MIINNNLPLRFVEYPEFRLMGHTMMKDGLNTAMSSKRLKHVIFEMYLHIISKIRLELDEIRLEFCNLPFISINCDGYTNKISGKKFIGLRAYYVIEQADSYKFVSKLLAMKPFSPTFQMRQDGLVESQLKYFTEALKLFSIRDYDIYGATSDAGPDIKYLLKEKLHLNWEWCFSHEFACAIKVRNYVT